MNLLESLPDGILLLHQKKVILANKSLFNLFEISLENQEINTTFELTEQSDIQTRVNFPLK